MTDAPRPSAAALSGGPRSTFAALAALVLVLGAACNNNAVAPSAAPTPTAGSSAQPPASIRPSSSPKADPANAAVTAFVALVTTDGFSYQATFTGNSRHTTDIFQMSKGLLQVSGDNVLVRATWAFPGHPYAVEHRYVGGKAWIKYDATDTWHRFAFQPADSMAAFASIHTRADLTYLGIVKSADKTYYQVSFRSAIVHPVMIPARNLTEAVVTSPKLTLLIDAAGRPVTGTAEIDGRGRVSGQLQQIVLDLTVTFIKLGQAVTIKAP